MRSRIIIFLSVFCLLFSTVSCKKAGRTVARAGTKKVVQKLMKFALGAALLVSVEEIVAGDMLDIFDEATKDKTPGEATIHNNYIENLTISISNDGNYWENKTIAVEDKILYPSTEKGLIAIHSGEGGYYMLYPGKEYAVKKDGDKIVVEEVDRPEE